MKLRFPLYTKILLWFFLNLVMLAAVLGVLVRGHFHSGFDWLLAAGAGQRIQAVSARIAASARSQAARELGIERRAAALLTAVEWRNGLRTPVSVTQVVTALHVCAGEPEAYRLSALFGPGCTARKASKETMMYAEWLQKRVQ